MEVHSLTEEQFLIFRLAGQLYGASALQIDSIERPTTLVPVPHTLSFIKGVVTVRNTVVPVVDLMERFDLNNVHSDPRLQRVVVVKMNQTQVGFLVDTAEDVLTLPKTDILPAPAMVGGIQAIYLRGIATWNNQPLVILDLTHILNETERRQLDVAQRVVEKEFSS
ncbi:purine-binding chemotaxis protein CheW [Alicyclobacillaceae bacterium I2511]|nr:purine-binding chemotaxis protein CheW [Alicyclobacillaceae bacterium I2511]